MDKILSEIRIAFRQFRDAFGFSATAVLLLAFGIAATTATFSVVEAVLLRPLPFHDPERLVAIGDRIEGTEIGNGIGAPVTIPEIAIYEKETHTLEHLGGYQAATYELSGVGNPTRVNATRLTHGVLPTLGVMPLMGRFFTMQEDADREHVALLSYSLWQSRLHSDPAVLGTKLLLDRQPYVVIGVMPRDFEFPLLPGHLNHSELWVPANFTPSELVQTGSWNAQIVGRLKPGVSIFQARADIEQVAHKIMRGFPPMMANIHISGNVNPLREDTIADARSLIRILFFAVCVVLLIACANLAGLLLVRAIRRRREIGVRLALGASTGALFRQCVLESLALSMTGGALGIVLSAIAIRASISQLPENLPRISEIGLNWSVVMFALVLAVVTGILCSLAPAFAAIRTDLNESLKEGGRGGSAGGGHARLRSSLVVVEIAIALVLVVASGLLLRSFEKMRAVDLGFRPENVVIASYSLPRQQYGSQSAVNRFTDEVLRQLPALPGVQSVGISSSLPMSGSNGTTVFVPEGYVPPDGASMSLAGITLVKGDFFSSMRVPLLSGRFFTKADRADAPLVVIVNHKLAQHYWPGNDPVGKRIRLGTPEMKSPWLTIVGEVADVKQDSPDGDTQEQYYEPSEQYKISVGELPGAADFLAASGYLSVRTTLPPQQMENALRATVTSLDAQLPLDQVQTMEKAVADSEAPRRFNTSVIACFAISAVLLAVLGIYSIVAFSVELRMREIAIRMALGSQPGRVIRLILGSALWLATFGTLGGILLSLLASRLLSSLLFEIQSFDPTTLVFAVAIVFLLVLVASLIPAVRAAEADPVQALRTE
jgi:putative ABC transport system permease protein